MDAVSSTSYGNPVLLAEQMRNTNGSDSEKVAADFEGLFVSQLLKEMRSTLEDGLFAGEGSDAYGGLFDMYLSQHISETGGLGVKDAILQSIESSQISGAAESS